MKTRLAIIAALAATAGMSTGAYAIPAPDAPKPGPGAKPVLFPSEQGAFKGLEVAKQLVESYILQKGCDEETFDLSASTLGNGEGTVVVDGTTILIKKPRVTFEGREYPISLGGVGPQTLGKLAVSDLQGLGSYNIGSEMQELETEWKMASPYSATPDNFRGTLIKDYWRLTALQPIPGICQTPSAKAAGDYGFENACTPVSTVIDYGYQEVEKHGFIAAKWWQQSQAWRQNGVRSGTLWHVTRVAPYGAECEITVVLQGDINVPNTANKQGFNQVGTISIGIGNSEPIGPYYKK